MSGSREGGAIVADGVSVAVTAAVGGSGVLLLAFLEELLVAQVL